MNELVGNESTYGDKKEYNLMAKKFVTLRKLREWADYNLESSILLVFGKSPSETTLKKYLNVIIEWLLVQRIIIL